MCAGASSFSDAELSGHSLAHLVTCLSHPIVIAAILEPVHRMQEKTIAEQYG